MARDEEMKSYGGFIPGICWGGDASTTLLLLVPSWETLEGDLGLSFVAAALSVSYSSSESAEQ